MNELFSVILSSVQADLGRTQRAAMNLANTQTAGYKRLVASSAPFSRRVDSARSAGVAGLATPTEGEGTDMRPGTLRSTGNSLHVAIVGDGWFEVSTGGGVAYTRQGNFRLDAGGRLVTQVGHPVMGSTGEIHLEGGDPLIDSAGRVFERAGDRNPVTGAAASPIAQIKVVHVDPRGTMRRLGDGLLLPAAEPVPAAEGTFQVQQAVIENSNVSPMQEMTALMQAVRHLEAMQKVATGYDEMLATSIRKLGEI